MAREDSWTDGGERESGGKWDKAQRMNEGVNSVAVDSDLLRIHFVVTQVLPFLLLTHASC